MSSPANVRYRLATPDDLRAQHRVFCRAESQVHRARRYPWVDPPFHAFALGDRHLQAHDAERCWVAELDGRVVGFTGAWVREDTWFLSRLFIDPIAQGRGIGRRLLAHALEDAPERRLTLTDSIQPISNALYGRNGLLPIAPLVRLAGTLAAREGASGLVAGEARIDDLAAIDRAAYGFDRRVDHEFWGSGWSRRAWFRGGELVAWSYRWPTGRLGPLAAIDGSSAADAYRAEVASGGAVELEVPASSRALLAAALADGLRIQPPMGLLLASDGIAPPDSIAISTYGFF